MQALLLVYVAATAAVVQGDTTFAVGDATRVVVEAERGDVEIRTWNRAEIGVSMGTRSAELTIQRVGTTLRVEQHHDWLGDDVDIQLTLPADLAIAVSGVFTSIDIEGVRGAVDAETVHGSVRLTGGSGLINLVSVQGGVRALETRGDLRLHSTNGDVLVRDHDGGVSVDAVNGSITLDDVEASSVEAESVNGTISYRGALHADGRYAFRSHSGGIVLDIPADADATVSVQTFAGEFESDFPVMLRETQGAGDFQFVIGSGAARVELESFAGLIRLRRRNGN